jgi:integrase
MADGLIPRNVTEGVKSPRPKKKEIKPLTAEQARCLLEAAHSERLEAAYVLALTASLREGELLGLKWEDVDLEGSKLSVRRTLSETKERGHVFEHPKKTARGAASGSPPERRRPSSSTVRRS